MRFDFDPSRMDPRVRQAWQRSGAVPPWLILLALVVAVLPLVALMLAVVGTWLVVALALSGVFLAIQAVRRAVGRLTGNRSENAGAPRRSSDSQGRRNVIVIRREEHRDFEDIN